MLGKLYNFPLYHIIQGFARNIPDPLLKKAGSGNETRSQVALFPLHMVNRQYFVHHNLLFGSQLVSNCDDEGLAFAVAGWDESTASSIHNYSTSPCT